MPGFETWFLVTLIANQLEKNIIERNYLQFKTKLAGRPMCIFPYVNISIINIYFLTLAAPSGAGGEISGRCPLSASDIYYSFRIPRLKRKQNIFSGNFVDNNLTT